MATKNPYRISITFYPGAHNVLGGNDSMKIVFSSKLCHAVNMNVLDVVSYELNGDLLSLKHESPRKQIGIQELASRVRSNGPSGGVINIGKKRMPKLFNYTIPSRATEIQYEVVDGKIVIDMNVFKQTAVEDSIGFKALKSKPVVANRGGFEVLRGLK